MIPFLTKYDLLVSDYSGLTTIRSHNYHSSGT